MKVFYSTPTMQAAQPSYFLEADLQVAPNNPAAYCIQRPDGQYQGVLSSGLDNVSPTVGDSQWFLKSSVNPNWLIADRTAYDANGNPQPPPFAGGKAYLVIITS